MSKSKTKVLWADPEKRPWRQLPALLGFIRQETSSFDCLQLRASLPRSPAVHGAVALWSGGLRVSSNAGEQYVSGSNDFVESEVWLPGEATGEAWFVQLQQEMKALEDISRRIYGCIRGYYVEQKAEGDGLAAQGTNLFWQSCERHFQNLVNACDQEQAPPDALQGLRRIFVSIALGTYDRFCANDTARQLDAWAKYRPGFAQYLEKEDT
jgi:CRISPR system Cascade subunit CasA